MLLSPVYRPVAELRCERSAVWGKKEVAVIGVVGTTGLRRLSAGVLSLLAALNPQTGEVAVQTDARHTRRRVVAFLKEAVATQSAEREVHVLLDHFASDQTGLLQRFFRQHPNVRLYSTPTYPDWRNQVETWLRRLQHGVIDSDLSTSDAEPKRKIMATCGSTQKPTNTFSGNIEGELPA